MITLDSGLTITNSTFSIVLSHQEPARVILAVPHDGLIKNDFSDLFQERKHGWHGRDVHVWPIANDVVQKCLRLGTRVDAVRFLMARAYIDANRELPSDNNLDSDILGQTALEDRRLISVYRHYHRELCQLVERSITAFGAQRIGPIGWNRIVESPQQHDTGYICKRAIEVLPIVSVTPDYGCRMLELRNPQGCGDVVHHEVEARNRDVAVRVQIAIGQTKCRLVYAIAASADREFDIFACRCNQCAAFASRDVPHRREGINSEIRPGERKWPTAEFRAQRLGRVRDDFGARGKGFQGFDIGRIA